MEQRLFEHGQVILRVVATGRRRSETEALQWKILSGKLAELVSITDPLPTTGIQNSTDF